MGAHIGSPVHGGCDIGIMGEHIGAPVHGGIDYGMGKHAGSPVHCDEIKIDNEI